MSKTIDLLGFNGYDFEMNSINAQKVNVVQSMIVNDVRNNVRIGTEAGDNLTTGYNNIIFGNHAGKYITIGHDNIILGTYAGYKINESYENCIMGMESAYNLTSGARNCTYGYRCGYAMDTCGFNTLMGNYCGASLVGGTSTRNVMIGFDCGKEATDVIDSVYIGQQAGQWMNGASNVVCGLNSGAGDLGSLISALNTTFVGFGAGRVIGNGIVNSVGIGTSAGEFMDMASFAVYVGTECGRYSLGDKNVYIGTTCGWDSSYATNCTGIGYACLWSGGGGGFNVACGSECLWSLTTGTRCVAIGYGCARDAQDAYDIVCLGTESASGITSGYNIVAIGTEALKGGEDDGGNLLSADATHAQLAVNAAADNDYYKYLYVVLTDGLGAGQARQITAYVGGTRTATISPAWSIVPNTSTTYIVSNKTDSGQCPLAPASTASTIVLRAAGSSRDDAFISCYCNLVGGTGSGQMRQITSYDGTTKIANITPNWSVVPDSTTLYEIYPISTNGYNLIALGSYSGLRILDNYDSICMGTNSARMGGGHENISLGVSSLQNLVSGPYNICLGKESARDLRVGETNCVLGYKAGRQMGDSAFVGALPAGITDTNSGNILVGYEAGYDICGPMNICIGTQAGHSDTLGIGLTNSAGNLILGYMGTFYRDPAWSTAGLSTNAIGCLAIGNVLSNSPPLILGTMPHVAFGAYPSQTASLVFNCLNSDLSTGEIINVGLVAKIGGVDGTIVGNANPLTPTLISADQLRNHVLVVTATAATTYIKLPTAANIAALFPNAYNFSPWPQTGMNFDITILYTSTVSGGSLAILSPDASITVYTGNNVVPYMVARTLKLYFTSSTTITALVC